ncbi:MAG: hypothetical protein PHN82_00780 [bacterium]|nr:hypothetical protein [bacterium]
MKRIVASLQLALYATVFGCGGMLHPPPPLTFREPLERPFGHVLAVGRFEDKSFARYPLFISGRNLQDLFVDELERNRAFRDVFAVTIEKKDTPDGIDEKALAGKADVILEGELTESLCRFVGSNALGVPMYILIGTVLGFPLGFNIRAQTWQGAAEIVYRIREIKTGRVLLARRVQAVAYRNFSIWEERTERQLNKNFVRRTLTPLVLQNLKSAVARDICDHFPR